MKDVFDIVADGIQEAVSAHDMHDIAECMDHLKTAALALIDWNDTVARWFADSILSNLND